MAMTCLAQYPVSPGHWHIRLTVCSRATRAPRCPLSNSRTARSIRISIISKYDQTRPRHSQDSEKATSRRYAQQLRPSLKMHVPQPMHAS